MPDQHGCRTSPMVPAPTKTQSPSGLQGLRPRRPCLQWWQAWVLLWLTSLAGGPRRAEAQSATLLPGVAEKFEHCELTLGSWCGGYYKQEEVPRPPVPRGNTPCPNNCTGIGWCNYDTGMCYCPAGWGGRDCATPRRRECLNMGKDKLDLGLAADDRWSHTRCAGICDDEIAMCYCPPGTKYGQKPAPKGSPLGTRPIYNGRPLLLCFPETDEKGNKVKFGHTPWADMFGPDGWCNSDTPKWTCPCRIDGMIGHLCNIVVEHVCHNQCTGHGDCYLGFCKCHEGWYGHDCSRKRAGLELEKGEEERGKPWLSPAITPVISAQDPPTQPMRKRPFIYVYDLLPLFNTDMMEWRIERSHCIYRDFMHGNRSDFIGYNAYSVESVLHELFLTSPHRTFDPEEADYFYVPAFTACLADVYGWNKIPKFPPDWFGTRVFGMGSMGHHAQMWIAQQFPYFNRSGGRDHIWVWAHDEGACYVHKDVWPGIMLTNWGRTDFPHTSLTSYRADEYHREETPKLYPQGWLNVSVNTHPCYDPHKDLVIPVHKPPHHYHNSPFLYKPIPGGKRDILMSFRGDLGLNREGCMYSRCLRQRLWNISQEQQWKEKHNVWYGGRDAFHDVKYSDLMSRSQFCLVLPGDGWSARFEDSILNGCIPVIIMDHTIGPFGTLIDYDQFSVRVAEKDLRQLVDIVKAIPPEKVKAMEAGVSKVWTRFRYAGLAMIDRSETNWLEQHKMDFGGSAAVAYPGSEKAGVPVDDAFSTIIQWLYHRIPAIRATRKGGGGRGLAGSSNH